MNIEQSNLENPENGSQPTEIQDDSPSSEGTERNSSLANMEKSQQGNDLQSSSNATVYGLRHLSEMPHIQEVIENCEESFPQDTSEIQAKVKEYFTDSVLTDSNGFLSQEETDTKAIGNKDEGTMETRDFGLDKCTDAAKKIFNPGVGHNWANLSDSQRMEIAGAYAAEAADAFELVKFNGISFNDLDGFKGKNDGKGNIYISNKLKHWSSSPVDLLNTITHEARHQYQIEAIDGYHNVPEEVVEEWKLARRIYNYNKPWCYDPWGYTYNPLEIDARRAGETVVKNWSRDYF